MSKRKQIVEIKVGEAVEIGGAVVSLAKKSGQLARLVVVADESVSIKDSSQLRAQASGLDSQQFGKPKMGAA